MADRAPNTIDETTAIYHFYRQAITRMLIVAGLATIIIRWRHAR